MQEIENKKIELAITILEENINKQKSIDTEFKKILIKTIKSNKNIITVIANKIKIDTKFYQLFISFNNLDNEEKRNDIVKKDNNYYKNFLRLKKYGIIHNSSSGFYPKSLKLVSINPHPNAFMLSDYSLIDKFGEKKFELENLLANNKKDFLLEIYYYLRFFHFPSFSFRQLARIEIENISIINEKKSFVLFYLDLLNNNDTEPKNKYYEIILLDEIVTNVLFKIKQNNRGYLFKEVKRYEIESQKWLKQDFNCSINTMILAKENYYIFNKSPLEASLINKNLISVNLSLAEINRLYPNLLDEEWLKDEEKRIHEVVRKSNYLIKEITSTINSKVNIYDLEDLLKLLRANKDISLNKQIEAANKEVKYFLKNNNNSHNNIYCNYLLDLLQSLSNKTIRLSTFINYFWIVNKHVFNMIENLSNIQYSEIQAIISRITKNKYKKSSKNKIQNRVKHFFKFCGTKEGFNIPIESMFYPKSLVFKEEINLILNKIEEKFIKKNSIKKFGQIQKFRLLQEKTFLLLGFYTGLRKNELRSRLLKDIYLFDNKLCIDVNKKGLTLLKMKLKTKSAKRRVEVFIEDDLHLSLIINFLNKRENLKKNSKFLFLDSSENSIYTKCINEEYVDNITISIKEVAKRYVTFHSLRHSFATYLFKKLIAKKKDFPYAMIQLSMMMGHETPEITLKNYVHFDYLRLLE